MVKEIDFNDFIDKYKSIINSVPLPQQKMVTDFERKCLAALMLESDQNNGFLEFGTWMGLTTSYLAKVCSHKTIWTVNPDGKDPDLTNKHQQNELLSRDEIGLECKGLSNVKIIYKDSFDLDVQADGIGTIDMCFIDGSHDVKHVLKDAENSLKVLRKGGILAFHNFNINHKTSPFMLGEFVEDGPCFYVEQHPNYDWKWIKNTVIVYCEAL